MREDAKITVTCDTCGDSIIWEPDYMFHSYSANSGAYDTSNSAYQEFMKSEGWVGDGEIDKCADCIEREGATNE